MASFASHQPAAGTVVSFTSHQPTAGTAASLINSQPAADADLAMDHFFKNWEFSLLRTQPDRIAHSEANDFEDEMYTDDANLGAATLLLKKTDLQAAKRLIDHSIAENPTSIHAQCSKGYYHLLQNPPDLKKAERAKSEMERLMKVSNGEPLRTAKIEYAYWLFSMERSEESREVALELMEDGLDHESHSDSSANINYSHHYLYAKALVWKAKTAGKGKDLWLPEIISKLFRQLTMLASSHEPEFEHEMWTFLANVQVNEACARIISSGQIYFSELQAATGTERFDLTSCVEKIIHLSHSHPDMKVKSNHYARLAGIFLKLAIWEKVEEKRKGWLDTALEFGKVAETATPSRHDIGPIMSARVLLHLWALDYQHHYPEVAEAVYRHHYNYSGPLSSGKVWMFLSTEYYGSRLDENCMTRGQLEEAKSHMIRCESQRRAAFQPEYVRILMLLGESDDVIEGEFDLFEKYAEPDANQGAILRHRGRFLEARKRYPEAKKCCEDAEAVFECRPPRNSNERYDQYQTMKAIKRLSSTKLK